MSPELFSRRYNLRGIPEELIYDDISFDTRTGFLYILEEFKNYLDDIAVINKYCASRRQSRNFRDSILSQNKVQRIHSIETWINMNKWWEFLDLCEIISLSFYKKDINKRGEFSRRLNSLFREENIGYEMQEGKIERIGNEFTDEYVKDARKLLKDLKFKGAEQHFEKAIKAINVRPNPDVENCVKDAVGAIESVGRIITGNKNVLLSDFIKDVARKGVIPKPLDQIFQKVYAYRGSEPGVAHGAVQASKVTADEAEFVLATSAAMIIYLVKKRSKS